jgi:type II secretory ATPase GspE/PulE/Tfp pilus assembly ATPase PilB-like protein
MQTLETTASALQKLNSKQITVREALRLIVDQEGIVNFEAIDSRVKEIFASKIASSGVLASVVPLLLYQNRFYLGSHRQLSPDCVRKLSDRLSCEIEMIAISQKSQLTYQIQQTGSADGLSNNPLDGNAGVMDISEVAAIQFAKVSEGDRISCIKAIISLALQQRASDIHLEPKPDGLLMRLRIDGQMRSIQSFPTETGISIVSAIKVMCNMRLDEKRKPQDGRISQTDLSESMALAKLDMRVSTLPCVNGEKVVIRLLPQDTQTTLIEELGFRPDSLHIFQRWLKKPQGVIILTGPTGSGKTSTLYASLGIIATPDVNVSTIEDPIEYVMPSITQTQVNEAAGMTFAKGLRALLRQDPDIVMVGEIRDAETAEIVTHAARTGHLVLTTMHTNNAVSAIPRLHDLGVDSSSIKDTLVGIIAQRLVRKVCDRCAEPYVPKESELQLLGLSRSALRSQSWRKGQGCAECGQTGFFGREALVEMLEVDRNVKQFLHESPERYLKSTNFHSFRNAAIDKIASGITTLDEVLRVLPEDALQDLSAGNMQSVAIFPLAI